MDNYKNIEEMNLRVSKTLACFYPLGNKKKYVLLFESVFGELCSSVLEKDKKRTQEKMAGLLNIVNALCIRVTTKSYNYDGEQLSYYLATSTDEYETLQEILECFLGFCRHFWGVENGRMCFDLAFYKSANFIFSEIFAFSERFLDGSLALCYTAEKLAERGVGIL